MTAHSHHHSKRISHAICGFVVALLLFAGAGTASATPISMDFEKGLAGPSGTISGSGTSWIGSGILLDLLQITIGAVTTSYDLGGYASSLGQGGTSARLSFDTALKTFSISGTIPALGITLLTDLVTGTFTAPSVFAGSGFFALSPSATEDTKDPILLALGLPPGAVFSGLGFVIGASTTSPGGPYTAQSTDFFSTANVVPEPGSLFLLGSGLLALGNTARKRLRRKSAN
jgi:hypothetical protein